jgi:hypothetical protein
VEILNNPIFKDPTVHVDNIENFLVWLYMDK